MAKKVARKAHTNANAANPAVARLRAQMESATSIEHALALVRSNLHATKVASFIGQLASTSEYRELALDISFPEEATEVKKNTKRWLHSLGEELLWNTYQVAILSEKLSSFLLAERKFQTHFLSGEYTKAQTELSKIKDEFGFSIWLLENEIALREAVDGLKGNKSYTQSIISKDSVDSDVRLVAYYVSLRAETTVSADKYQATLRQNVPGITTPTDHNGQYLAFRLNFFGPTRFHELAAILVLERNSSAIDRYLGLLRVCQLIVADETLHDRVPIVRKVVETLFGRIVDDRIETLATALKLSRRNQGESPGLAALDLYTTGRYMECGHAAIAAIASGEIAFEWYELLAKSAAREPSLIDSPELSEVGRRLSGRLRDLLVKSERSAEAYQFLLKQVYALHSWQWAGQLFGFLMREYRHESVKIPLRYQKFSELCGKAWNPRLRESFGKHQTLPKRRYPNKDATSPLKSPTHVLIDALANKNIQAIKESARYGVPSERITKYCGLAYERLEKFPEAIVQYSTIAKCSDVLYRQDGIEALVRVWLQLEEVDKAAKLLVQTFLENPRLRPRLPVEECIDQVERHLTKALQSSISLPILYDIYSRTVGPDRDVKRALAYEEFLNANGAKRPSDLKSRVSDFPEAEIRYFLRYVCVYQAMDTSIEFSSTEEIENERISLCQILSEIDPSNTESYLEEIKDITQRLMISKGILAVEKSKIYVDVEGIKAALEQSLREAYVRFQSFINIGPKDDATVELVLQIERILGDRAQTLKFVLPASQRFQAFKDLFYLLRDAFISSNAYGLDGYLSVGIRHGTLTGQIRSPLEVHELVTQKDESGQYKESTHWLGLLSIFGWDQTLAKGVDDRLKQFSNEVDKYIDDIRERFLQIRTEGRNTEGLFDYSYSDPELLALQRRIPEKMSYEDAVSELVRALWDTTDRRLEIVRQRVSNEYKRTLTSMLDGLQQDIHSIAAGHTTAQLDNAIAAARTLIQGEVDKIAAWFTRSGASDIGEFNVELAIDIAAKMCNNIHPTRNLTLFKELGESVRCAGWGLKGFVQVFYMLFDNIVTHGGESDAHADLRMMREPQGQITFCLSNTIGQHIDLETLSERVRELNVEIGKDRSYDRVRSEGGTGLHKVAKILAVDLKTSPKLTAYVRPDRRFEMLIELPLEGVFL